MTAVNPIGIHTLAGVGDTSPESVTSAITSTKQAGYGHGHKFITEQLFLNRVAA